MAKTDDDQDVPFFVGTIEDLQAFANWLNDFERAAICRISPLCDTPAFVADIGALNKALANGSEHLGCFNPDDAVKARRYIGALQRDVAALLAGGLESFLFDSEDVDRREKELKRTLDSATPYLRWLGVKVRDELAKRGDVTPVMESGSLRTKPQSKKTVKQKGRPKADYQTIQKEAGIARDWKRAKAAGTAKKAFARDIKMPLADLDRLLERVASRERPSE